MLNILWNLIIFIITMGILITVHEFGHFWIARRCGVKIEHFSIGFGKVIWKYINRRGTKFIIALIPLGGYVKMFDKNSESVTPETYQYTFNSKTISQRVGIIAGGPIANFIFAIFAYWLAFIIGIPGIRPIVNEIIPNSIAANAGIESGMELKFIDGVKTPDLDAVRSQLITKIGNNSTKISVASLNSDKLQDKVLNLHYLKFEPDKEDPIISLGIRPYYGIQIDPVLTEIQIGSAASKAGLQTGDRISKINGQPLTQWIMFVNLIRNNPGKQLTLEIERQGNLLLFNLIPEVKLNNGKLEGFAGVAPKVSQLPNKYKIIHQYDPFSAILKAIDKTWQLIKLTIKMLGKLIIGDIKLNNLGGPISIAKGAGISANFGIVYYLMFIAIISINLGIINLFPIPILDGGHILFLVIEKFRGKLISEQIQDISYRIGSIIIALLIGFALFNDFSKL